MKILLSILFLLPLRVLSQENALSEETLEKLRSGDPWEAGHAHLTIKTNALHTTGQEPNHAWIEKSREELAKNPKLEPFFKGFFEETPNYVENTDKRKKAASILSELRTPWAARLLGELLMKEETLG